jgi:hypothetical protein
MKYNRMHRVLRWLAASSTLVMCFGVSLKLASAAPGCGDSTSNVEPVGWSPSGLSILIRHEDFRDCIRKIALEVHNVGATGPAACHDLLGAPEKRIDCAAVLADKLKQPGVSSQEGIYNVPIESIDPAWVELTYATPVNNAAGSALKFVVKLSGQSAALATIPAQRVANNVHPEDGILNEPQVAVLPTRDRKKAALLFRGIDTAPGVGHRGWILRWVPLAETTAPTVPGVKRSVPSLGPIAASPTAITRRASSCTRRASTLQPRSSLRQR